MSNERVEAIKFYDTLPHILLLSVGYPGGIKEVDMVGEIKAISWLSCFSLMVLMGKASVINPRIVNISNHLATAP